VLISILKQLSNKNEFSKDDHLPLGGQQHVDSECRETRSHVLGSWWLVVSAVELVSTQTVSGYTPVNREYSQDSRHHFLYLSENQQFKGVNYYTTSICRNKQVDNYSEIWFQGVSW